MNPQQPTASEDLSITLPITEAARQIAQQFARQQPTPEKAAQVLSNTLAVLAVDGYLQMLGIPTNLKASDSWNPAVRMCADVADLEVIGIGRLECRPLHMGDVSCHVPLEVWEDRIGYLAVRLDRELKAGMILGFVPSVTGENLPVSQLQPIEELSDRLHQVAQSLAPAHSLAEDNVKVNLSQWFQNTFEAGWQEVEALLNTSQTSLAFRFREAASRKEERPIRRGKLIDLGIQLAGQSVALILEIKPSEGGTTHVCLQVHPTGSQTYLPPNLQLAVFDETGSPVLEANSRRKDNYIQLQLNGEPGECFSVKVTLAQASITEQFMI